MADTKDSGLDPAQALADADIVAVTQDVAGTLASRRTTIAAIKTFLGAMANPMTTAGDLIIGGLAGAAARLAAGTNGQVLKMVGGAPAWAAESGGGGASAAPVVTEAGTALAATDANSGNYTRFTSASAKTYTFDSGESYTIGDEYHGRNVGAGDLTLAEAGTFVLNPPVGGTLVVAQGGTFTVKIVGADEADVFGVTVAA
ncbi:MAG: hypothetical protein ACREPV_01210 [Lysobacter sp.]